MDVKVLTENMDEDAFVEEAASPSRTSYRNIFCAYVIFSLYSGITMPSFIIFEQYIYSEIGKEKGYQPKSTSDACSSNDTMKQLQQQVQSEASLWMIVYSVIGLITTAVTTAFLAPYSDSMGRKPTMIMPIVGGTVKAIIFLLVTTLKLPMQVMLIGCFFEGLTGSWVLMVTGMIAYVADSTAQKHRSICFFVLEMCLGIANLISQTGFGYLLDHVGYTMVFIVMISMFIGLIIFVFICVAETVVKSTENNKLFTLKHVKKSFTVYLVDDVNRRKLKLFILLLIMLCTSTGAAENSDVLTYYLLDNPLCFTPTQIGLYNGILQVYRGIFGVLVLAVLSRCVGDLAILSMACLSCIVYQVILPLFQTSTGVYIGIIASFGGLLYNSQTRAVGSKLVHPNEQGAVFGTMTWVQMVGNVFSTVILNFVYVHTLAVNTGIAFWVGGGLFGVAGLLVVYLIVKK